MAKATNVKKRDLAEILRDVRSEERFDVRDDEETKRRRGFLLYLTQKEDGQKFVAKMLHDKTKARISYDIKNDLEDFSHIVRMIGDEPVKYGSYEGVLMEEADYDLEDYILSSSEDYSSNLDATVEDIMIQISSAVKKIHDTDRFYRDIKLQNFLFYEKYGEWVGTDFDDTKERSDTSVSGSNYTPNDYLAYEQPFVNNKIYNFKTDIFALGCVMKQLVEGNVDGKTQTFYHDAMAKNIDVADDEAYRDFIHKTIDSYNISDKLKHVLKRMTDFAENRYPSIDALLGDLRADSIKSIKDYKEVYSNIEQQYLSKIRQVTNTDSELLRASQIERLLDTRNEFEQQVNTELSDYVSGPEVNNLLQGNSVDKEILKREQKDEQYIKNSVSKARGFKNKLNKEAEFDGEKRGGKKEYIVLDNKKYDQLENQLKQLLSEGSNLEKIAKTWDQCLDVVRQYAS